jgi:uncharacterized protein involved in outer membrane biogenesis
MVMEKDTLMLLAMFVFAAIAILAAFLLVSWTDYRRRLKESQSH